MEKLYNNGITDIRIYLRTNLYHTMSLAFFVFLTSFRTYGIFSYLFYFLVIIFWHKGKAVSF